MVLRFVLFFFCLGSLHTGYSQTVYEPLYRSVYPYLERLSQRGVIELHDVIQPISRKDIAVYLHDLEQKKDKLTPLELKELTYYKKEYIFESNLLYADSLISEDERPMLLKIPSGERPRLAALQSKNLTFNVQPIVGLDYTSGEEVSNSTFRAGFWAHGYIRKRLGVSIDYRSYVVSGDGIDYSMAFTPEHSFIGQRKRDGSLVGSEIKATLSYDWDWAVITVGKDVMPIGYGANGRLILSDKAPSFPMIRMDLKVLKWLSFNYAHIWLNSDVTDSTRIRYAGSGNNYQINEVPKKMATHSLIFYPVKGLSLTLGESIIYNDEVKLGYLLPISFYRPFSKEQGEAGGTTFSNSQLFTQISSRNHIPNTHLYGSFFMDEFRFEDTRRNQTGYNVGLSVTDFPLKNLFLSTDYTRIRPYTYIHHMNSLDYRHAGYELGHWIGTNSDQWTLNLRYRITRGLELFTSFRSIRKGSEGVGSDQLSEVGTPFLWGNLKKVQQTDFQIRYELLHDLFVRTTYRKEKVNNADNDRFSLSLSYGF